MTEYGQDIPKDINEDRLSTIKTLFYCPICKRYDTLYAIIEPDIFSFDLRENCIYICENCGVVARDNYAVYNDKTWEGRICRENIK